MAQNPQSMVRIRSAVFPDDKEIVAKLFLAYAQSLPIDLEFQNFKQELLGLPGKYAVENGGDVYLAYTTSTPPTSASSPNGQSTQGSPQHENVIGCIAIRSFAPPDKCELKRLYLTPESRGLGVSKLLMDVSLQRAKELGYKEMLLDTLRSMSAARGVYQKHGFVEVEPYYQNPNNAVFYRKEL